MEGPVRHAVHRLKYGNLRSIAPLLGELMAEFMAAEGIDGDTLVPVPLHPRRERQRGYNQAHLLAREAGKLLEIPVTTRAISRVSNAPPQARSVHSAGQEGKTYVTRFAALTLPPWKAELWCSSMTSAPPAQPWMSVPSH